MNKFTIYCTEEQTKKALELGAPIMVTDTLGDLVMANYFTNEDNHVATIIPTVEQMIGWLEEQGIMLEIEYNCTYKNYNYTKNFRNRNGWGSKIFDSYTKGFHTRKEATLAAIDAALDYLIKRGGDNE